MKNLYLGIKSLNASQNTDLAKRVKKGDKIARQKMIEGNAGFAYKRAIKYANMNKGWGQIDDDDILQASMLGLIEAVDKFDPGRGYSFTTYAHFWIAKRISDEVSSRHWNTVKPPRESMRRFLYRKMDEEESADYVSRFMSRGGGDHADTSRYEDDGFLFSEIVDAVERSNLTARERVVFDNLYGQDRTESLKEFSDEEINSLEKSLLNKLKGQFT